MMRLQALRKGNWEERTNMIQCDFKITTRIFAEKGANKKKRARKGNPNEKYTISKYQGML